MRERLLNQLTRHRFIEGSEPIGYSIFPVPVEILKKPGREQLLKQLEDLDCLCYGERKDDPFYLNGGSSHILVASKGEEPVGVLAFMVREVGGNEGGYIQYLNRELEKMGVPLLPDGARLIPINNIVSCQPGVGKQLISQMEKDFQPAMIIALSRSARFITCLQHGLGEDFRIYVGGVPLGPYDLDPFTALCIRCLGRFNPFVAGNEISRQVTSWPLFRDPVKYLMRTVVMATDEILRGKIIPFPWYRRDYSAYHVNYLLRVIRQASEQNRDFTGDYTLPVFGYNPRRLPMAEDTSGPLNLGFSGNILIRQIGKELGPHGAIGA